MSVEDLRNNPEVREVFLSEVRRRLKDAERILKGGELPPPGSDGFETLHRHAHTLKGLGATLGYKEMEALSLEILDQLKAARKKDRMGSQDESRVIVHDFERLAEDVDLIAHGVPPGAAAASGEAEPPAAAAADGAPHEPLGSG